MHATRKDRLDQLRAQFSITEVNGQYPPAVVIAATIALHLNTKYGREVVVPRDRRGWSE